MGPKQNLETTPWWIWLCMAVLVVSGPLGIAVFGWLTSKSDWAYLLAIPPIASLIAVSAYWRAHERS